MKRIIKLIPVLLAITFMVFTLMYITPGDPALQKLTSQGGTVTPELLAEERHAMGLDRPFLVRYLDWVLNILQGDLGTSYSDGQPVASKLMKALGTTEHCRCLHFVSVVIAIP